VYFEITSVGLRHYKDLLYDEYEIF